MWTGFKVGGQKGAEGVWRKREVETWKKMESKRVHLSNEGRKRRKKTRSMAN